MSVAVINNIDNVDNLNAIYDAVVAKGSTPASHSVSDIVAAIAAIPTDVKHTIGLSAKEGWVGVYVWKDGSKTEVTLNGAEYWRTHPYYSFTI